MKSVRRMLFMYCHKLAGGCLARPDIKILTTMRVHDIIVVTVRGKERDFFACRSSEGRMKNYTDENELREEKSADEIVQEEIAPALACAQDDREEIAQDASLRVVSEADGQEKELTPGELDRRKRKRMILFRVRDFVTDVIVLSSVRSISFRQGCF